MKKRNLCVISHTHWDREWYEVFQEYRMRLVRMIDHLLDILEQDEQYAYFHLDGQTIVLEDYLEIRPQNKERLYRLIRSGRILIGPWYVMPDEFLVSGESLIRNLGIGMELCREAGADPMPCGYIPDLFGHNNQFPQILRGFDLDSTLLFRGVADYPKDAFNWKGLDGSCVTAFRVDRERAYSNFYFAVRNPFEGGEYDEEKMAANMQALLERMDPEATSDVYLLMDGVDHIDPEEKLPWIIETLQRRFPNDRFEHTTLPEYIRRVREADPALETVEGSLYHIGQHGINNWLLKNVLSSMVHNKQHNDACERALSGLTEPMQAFLDIESGATVRDSDVGGREDFLHSAWKTLVKNHPHDSICGCSASDVHEDMEYRFRQTAAIARALTKNMGEQLCAALDTAGYDGCHGVAVAYNPTQTRFQGVNIVKVLLPQLDLNRLEFLDREGQPIPAQLLSTEPVMEHRYPLKTLIQFEPKTVAVYAMPLDIPANGYQTFGYRVLQSAFPGPGEYTAEWENPCRLAGSMRTAPLTFDTGKLAVTFAHDGTLSVTDHAAGRQYTGLLRLEDGGDNGDGYNYVRPMADEVCYSNLADLAVLCDGPLAAVVKITAHMDLPAHREAPGVQERCRQDIEHTVTLLRDSDRIALHTKVCNQTRNHRMRMLFPTGLSTDAFFTKTPFAMTEWQVKEPGWECAREQETFVHPSQGVSLIRDEKAAVAVYTRGLYEVSVSEDDSRTLAVTLFRSFPGVAGGLHSEMGAMLREMEFDLTLHLNPQLTPDSALAAGEAWRQGLQAFSTGVHEGVLPPEQSFLAFADGSRLIQSSFASQLVRCGGREEKAYVLRVYDVSGQASDTKATFPWNIRSAVLVNMKGECGNACSFDGRVLELHAEPYQIVSVALQFDRS